MSGTALTDCGCCEGLTGETPGLVENRAGLSAIAYRCGTHSQFKESMLAALSSSQRLALQRLNTREDDDFSIALLDAWAVVADVLTFYQERIANESFLRTATERLSLLQLARLIGYELRPGVAASTYLAFMLEDAVGAPRTTTIDIGTRVQSIPGPNEKPQTFETIEKFEARVEWNALKVPLTQLLLPGAGSDHLYLQGVATNLKPGDPLLFVGTTSSGARGELRLLKVVTVDREANRTRVEWADLLTAANPKAFALRQRASLFGYNAPHPSTLSDQALLHYDNTTIFKKKPPPLSDWTFSISTQTIDLDTTYPAILNGSWIVLSNSSTKTPYLITDVTESSRSAFALSGKTTRLTLDSNTNLKNFFSAPADQHNIYRDTTVFAQSELLELAEAPRADPVQGDKIEFAGTIPGLVPKQALAISGKRDGAKEDATVYEICFIANRSTAIIFDSNRNLTKVQLQGALQNSYDRTTFAANANVALATHGETKDEVLGSGDASQPYQHFTLQQPPLTFVHGSSASGTESTLQVRVNDVLWHETPTLFARTPRDRVFVTRTDDDGKTTVQFGDGVTGARLPNGQENVRATYRQGIGLEGLVKADQLSLLLSRPLGAKAVTNPVNADGAADRESLADARANAPLTVLTLDRIVTLRDYQDFVRCYAGVAKALATWTWDGRTRGVFITVAGPAGAEINLAGDFGNNLMAAIRQAGDPFVPVQVKSYKKNAALFRLSARVKVDPDYETASVLAAVEAALRTKFSFDARNFGQPVVSSEVIAVMQSVPGVVAVDLNNIHRVGRPPSDRLLAALPKTGTDGLEPAELIVLDSAPLELSVML